MLPPLLVNVRILSLFHVQPRPCRGDYRYGLDATWYVNLRFCLDALAGWTDPPDLLKACVQEHRCEVGGGHSLIEPKVKLKWMTRNIMNPYVTLDASRYHSVMFGYWVCTRHNGWKNKYVIHFDLCCIPDIQGKITTTKRVQATCTFKLGFDSGNTCHGNVHVL